MQQTRDSFAAGAGAALALIAVALSGCTVTPTVTPNSAVEESTAQHFAAPPDTHVLVSTFAGDLDIVAGTAGTVDVQVTKVTYVPTADAARRELANIDVGLAQAEDGSIVVGAKALARLDPRTVANVRIVAPDRMVFELSDSVGNISIAGATSATVDARVTTGNLRFSGSLAKGAHAFAVSTGQIDLTLPKDASFMVDASVNTGSIRNDFGLGPATANKLKATFGNAPSATITASVGTGGVALRAGPPMPVTPPITKSGLTPEQAVELIRITVTEARPILVPNVMPADWKAQLSVEAGSFFSTFRSPDGSRSVTLAIAAANPALPGPATSQAYPSFHGDATSLYQVADATNPTSGRILVWAEKGTWSVSGRAEVPYMLSSEGLTDAEFWQIANGLHPNQI